MSALTEQEAQLYDRQLRLWGVAAQQRLRDAKVLLYGFTAVQAEICKNLVLSGVNSVTIHDDKLCTERDLGANFFLDEASIGVNRAEAALSKVKALNPLVKVLATQFDTISKVDFTQFHLCCFSGVPMHVLVQANAMARKAQTQFFAADTTGFFGFVFEDLGDVFAYEKTIENEKEGTKETKRLVTGFVELENALQSPWKVNTSMVFIMLLVLRVFWEKHKRNPTVDDTAEIIAIRDAQITHQTTTQPNPPNFRKLKNDSFYSTYVRQLGAELSPVCAIVGGIAAQEIVRAICRNEEPLKNLFTYNGLDGGGWVGELFNPK